MKRRRFVKLFGIGFVLGGLLKVFTYKEKPKEKPKEKLKEYKIPKNTGMLYGRPIVINDSEGGFLVPKMYQKELIKFADMRSYII